MEGHGSLRGCAPREPSPAPLLVRVAQLGWATVPDKRWPNERILRGGSRRGGLPPLRLHLSTSPRTVSAVPMIAIMSAIMWLSAILSSAWRLTNEADRNFTRRGL